MAKYFTRYIHVLSTLLGLSLPIYTLLLKIKKQTMSKENTYLWRNNFTTTFLDQKQIVRGKLAVKTKTIDWLGTRAPVVVLVSVHSKFHELGNGDLKMQALVSTIKSHVQGRITILICDVAHLNTLSLSHQGDLDKAYEECLREAQLLKERYASYFAGCDIAYWHSYINQDKNYNLARSSLRELYRVDPLFRKYLYEDAEATYTSARMRSFPKKIPYIEKTVEDLLEQCSSLIVLSRHGYRYKFYPGSSYASVLYANKVLLSEEEQISWVDVFVSIEKKTIAKVTVTH